MQKPGPELTPSFTAIGTACSDRRMPPSTLPKLSRTGVAGDVEVSSMRGAVGGGVPSTIQRTRCS